jgi:hypothetical protein
MIKSTRFVGLDVHSETIAAAVGDGYLLACRALFDVKTSGTRASLNGCFASTACRRRSAATTARPSRRLAGRSPVRCKARVGQQHHG